MPENYPEMIASGCVMIAHPARQYAFSVNEITLAAKLHGEAVKADPEKGKYFVTMKARPVLKDEENIDGYATMEAYQARPEASGELQVASPQVARCKVRAASCRLQATSYKVHAASYNAATPRRHDATRHAPRATSYELRATSCSRTVVLPQVLAETCSS